MTGKEVIDNLGIKNMLATNTLSPYERVCVEESIKLLSKYNNDISNEFMLMWRYFSDSIQPQTVLYNLAELVVEYGFRYEQIKKLCSNIDLLLSIGE